MHSGFYSLHKSQEYKQILNHNKQPSSITLVSQATHPCFCEAKAHGKIIFALTDGRGYYHREIQKEIDYHARGGGIYQAENRALQPKAIKRGFFKDSFGVHGRNITLLVA